MKIYGDIFGWVLSALTIIGCTLNVFRNRWGWIIWLIANIGWMVFDARLGIYERMPAWIAMSLLCVYGFYKWSIERKEKCHTAPPLVVVA